MERRNNLTPAAYLKLIMRVLGVREKTALELECYKEFCQHLDTMANLR